MKRNKYKAGAIKIFTVCFLIMGCRSNEQILETLDETNGGKDADSIDVVERKWFDSSGATQTGFPGLIFWHSDYFALFHPDAAIVQIFSNDMKLSHEFTFISGSFPPIKTPNGLICLKNRIGIVDAGESKIVWSDFSGKVEEVSIFKNPNDGALLLLSPSIANANYQLSDQEDKLWIPVEPYLNNMEPAYYQSEGLIGEIDLKENVCTKIVGKYPEVYREKQFLASLRDIHIAIQNPQNDILIGFDASASIKKYYSAEGNIEVFGFEHVDNISPYEISTKEALTDERFYLSRDKGSIFSDVYFNRFSQEVFRLIILPAKDTLGMFGIPEVAREKLIQRYDSELNLVRYYYAPKGFSHITKFISKEKFEYIGFSYDKNGFYIAQAKFRNSNMLN